MFEFFEKLKPWQQWLLVTLVLAVFITGGDYLLYGHV